MHGNIQIMGKMIMASHVRDDSERIIVEFLKRQLRQLQESDDVASAHESADAILCSFLVGLGFEDIVEEYRKVPKWFA